jgi:hypothetical protein
MKYCIPTLDSFSCSDSTFTRLLSAFLYFCALAVLTAPNLHILAFKLADCEFFDRVSRYYHRASLLNRLYQTNWCTIKNHFFFNCSFYKMFVPLHTLDKDKKPPDDELRFETYVGVQTFYKIYNKKKWFLIVHQLVWYNIFDRCFIPST